KGRTICSIRLILENSICACAVRCTAKCMHKIKIVYVHLLSSNSFTKGSKANAISAVFLNFLTFYLILFLFFLLQANQLWCDFTSGFLELTQSMKAQWSVQCCVFIHR